MNFLRSISWRTWMIIAIIGHIYMKVDDGDFNWIFGLIAFTTLISYTIGGYLFIKYLKALKKI